MPIWKNIFQIAFGNISPTIIYKVPFINHLDNFFIIRLSLFRRKHLRTSQNDAEVTTFGVADTSVLATSRGGIRGRLRGRQGAKPLSYDNYRFCQLCPTCHASFAGYILLWVVQVLKIQMTKG